MNSRLVLCPSPCPPIDCRFSRGLVDHSLTRLQGGRGQRELQEESRDLSPVSRVLRLQGRDSAGGATMVHSGALLHTSCTALAGDTRPSIR